MVKKFRYLLAFVFLALLVAAVAWKYTFRKADISVGARKADIQLEAPLLLQAFEQNEDSANAKYLDKVIEVSGTVESVSHDSTGVSVYLKEKGAASGVMCGFEQAAYDSSQVKAGARLRVKGLCSGYLMDVILNKCSLVNPPE